MKILFSNPCWWSQEPGQPLRKGIRAGSRWPFTMQAPHLPDQFKFGGYLPFPFFLGYAASFTAKALPDAIVAIRDSIARGESYGKFLQFVVDFAPEWIVIETATPSWEHDARVITLLQAKVPGAKVILCGTLDCTKSKEITAAHRNVWAIVQGEYDKQISKMILLHDSLNYPDSMRNIVVPHDLLTLAEMNEAPSPMFDEGAAMNYWDACPAGNKAPQLQVWSSRGCPFKCCFCVWPAVMTGNDPDGTKTRSVRCYSVEYMEAFLTERIAWAKARGTPYASLYDDSDTFNLIQKHTVEMCGVYKRIGLPWSAMCRADTIDDATWQLMKDSGCTGVKLGFESGNQWVIDNIVNKRLNLKKAAETAMFIRGLGMSVHGTFTVGLPGETEAQQQDTIDFIRELYAAGAIDTHQLSGTATVEGTPLAAIARGDHLAKYPGATNDGFVITGDGQAKIEGIRA